MEQRKATAQLILKKDIEHVLNLEAKRKDKGFKPGWLFFKCKDIGLLNVLEHLRNEGLIESPFNKRKPNQKIHLSIELVPKSCWYSNVRSEVKASDWEKLKTHTFQKAKFKCEVCGGHGPKWPVECHEIWHYDDSEHIQSLLGLVALVSG